MTNEGYSGVDRVVLDYLLRHYSGCTTLTGVYCGGDAMMSDLVERLRDERYITTADWILKEVREAADMLERQAREIDEQGERIEQLTEEMEGWKAHVELGDEKIKQLEAALRHICNESLNSM